LKPYFIVLGLLYLFSPAYSEELHSPFPKGVNNGEFAMNKGINRSELFDFKAGKDLGQEDTTSLLPQTSNEPAVLHSKSAPLNSLKSDTIRLVPVTTISAEKSLNELVTRNNFTKKMLKYLVTSPQTQLEQVGVPSISYFTQFKGKRIASIRFIRLHPFGTSLRDTTLDATKWIDKAGNRLHMNTTKSKLRMQLQFNAGELVNPLLMAENEKLMRDLSYLEDVSFLLEPVENQPDAVNVVVISKDKFEYAVSMSVNTDNSNIEFANVNMFGLGHRLNIGMAQKNEYLPEMGVYASYHVNNIFNNFINSTIGFTDTYIKKGWNTAIEKKFLTSREKNAGGFAFEQVSKYNYIAEDHPIELDTTVAYTTGDLWFIHAFSNPKNQNNKTLLSMRYYHQQFNLNDEDSYGESEFLRNHDFILAGLAFSRRNLYKNNLVYGYGVTEDIPFGHYYEINAGFDKSQFGVWPYANFSLSNAFIDLNGNYYAAKLGADGFFDNGVVKQATLQANLNFFTKKFFFRGDPFRQFIKVEFLGGIHRLDEEYLTIDGRFGIRDFYTDELKGRDRLKINLETVRFLKGNFYGFKFTNYIFTDFAFLSENLHSLFKSDFYAGIGTGLRIYNESLFFKIIDIRLTWFPIIPPESISPFAVNLQGVTRSRFDDFLGKRPEVIRYQ